jgi:hypothetical protein
VCVWGGGRGGRGGGGDADKWEQKVRGAALCVWGGGGRGWKGRGGGWKGRAGGRGGGRVEEGGVGGQYEDKWGQKVRGRLGVGWGGGWGEMRIRRSRR